MTVTPDFLLSQLPPYRDAWVLVTPDQTVTDIIAEVLKAHSENAPLYDRIALYFDAPTIREVCEKLYNFCLKYMSYDEENEDFQSVSVPQGLLTRGKCDCKGYASFCAGVLGGLERLTGKKIPWRYRFASYKTGDHTPHHVFIVAMDHGTELWLDPTPGSADKTPASYVDKKVKNTASMALHKNIAGIDNDYAPDDYAYPGTRAIGLASETVSLRYDALPNLNFDPVTQPLPLVNPWPHYLGLDKYRDYYGDRNISEANVAAQINTAIQNGPAPGHSVTPDFVKWVYDNSIRSWNFYYPNGVDPSFDVAQFTPKIFHWKDSSGNLQTVAPPLYVITKDNRVTFDHDVKLDDFRNWLIHILTAGAQNYINKYDQTGFPLKPADLKNFSQAYTGNPNNPAASILHEWRGSSDVAKLIQATTSFISDTILKIAGAIPRNAFLALVGINLFRMATDLQNSINSGHWDDISRIWQELGGDPDKLKNTIAHGSGQPETDNTSGTVNSADQISGVTMGNPAVIAAVITAATPVVVALAKYFSHSSVSGIAQNGVNSMNAANPQGGYQMVNGVLYSNGKPVSITGDTEAQLKQSSLLKNLAISGAVGGLLYFLIKGKKKRASLVLPAAAGAGVFLLLQYKSNQQIAAQTAVVPQAVPSVAPSGAGIIPSLLPGITNLITTITTQPQAAPTPTSPVTAGSGAELPAGYSSDSSGLYAV